MNNIKSFEKFSINELGGYYDDPPEPESTFSEDNEAALLYLEELLRAKNHMIPDDVAERLIAANTYDQWDEELGKKYQELYDKEYVSGFDDEHDTEIFTPMYHKITEDAKKNPHYNKASYADKRQLVFNALYQHITKKHAEEFWPIYDKYIKELK